MYSFIIDSQHERFYMGNMFDNDICSTTYIPNRFIRELSNQNSYKFTPVSYQMTCMFCTLYYVVKHSIYVHSVLPNQLILNFDTT